MSRAHYVPTDVESREMYSTDKLWLYQTRDLRFELDTFIRNFPNVAQQNAWIYGIVKISI